MTVEEIQEEHKLHKYYERKWHSKVAERIAVKMENEEAILHTKVTLKAMIEELEDFLKHINNRHEYGLKIELIGRIEELKQQLKELE